MKWQYANRKHRSVFKQGCTWYRKMQVVNLWSDTDTVCDSTVTESTGWCWNRQDAHDTGKCKLWGDSTITESTRWCWNRQGDIIIICQFYIMLISALRLTEHMLHAIPNGWLYPFCSTYFLYPQKWCTDRDTVWLLHGWCHVKLLPSQCKFCIPCSTIHQFTVSLHSNSKPHR